MFRLAENVFFAFFGVLARLAQENLDFFLETVRPTSFDETSHDS